MKHIIVSNESNHTFRVYRNEGDAIARAAEVVAEFGAGMANVYQFVSAEALVEDGIRFILADYTRETTK